MEYKTKFAKKLHESLRNMEFLARSGYLPSTSEFLLAAEIIDHIADSYEQTHEIFPGEESNKSEPDLPKPFQVSIHDNQFRDFVIQEVRPYGNGFVMRLDDTGHVDFPSIRTAFIPKAGMCVRLYGPGIGYPFRGMVIDGTVIYYNQEIQVNNENL